MLRAWRIRRLLSAIVIRMAFGGRERGSPRSARPLFGRVVPRGLAGGSSLRSGGSSLRCRRLYMCFVAAFRAGSYALLALARTPGRLAGVAPAARRGAARPADVATPTQNQTSRPELAARAASPRVPDERR